MRIGSLVRAKHRYIGQLFIVVDKREYYDGMNKAAQIKCVRVEDGFKTRYSKSSTWEVVC